MKVYSKLIQLLALFPLMLQVEAAPRSSIATDNRLSYVRSLPQRTIGGVRVVDSPIVRDAHDYAVKHCSDFVYKHIMRSWLFGVLIINHNETLRKSVDLEVHAVSVLLHDLGWDQTPGSPFISKDKRFEVDGAIAARDFLGKNKYGKSWDQRRVQLVWDAIALHSQPAIADFKEFEVMTASSGINSDFSGPSLGVAKQEYDAVVSAFPSNGMRDGFNNTIIWLCQSKPATTYDTWMQPWGDNYVSTYQSVGNRIFDNAFKNFP